MDRVQEGRVWGEGGHCLQQTERGRNSFIVRLNSANISVDAAPSLLVPRLCCENTPAPPPGAHTESAALNCDRELFVRDGPPLVYWPTTRKENTLISRVSYVSCWSPKSGCGEGDLAIYIIFTIVCVHVCEGKSF